MGLDIKVGNLVRPGKNLQYIYEVTCKCGYHRDHGYKEITAQRDYEIHTGKCPFDTTITKEQADDYKSPAQIKKMTKDRLHRISGNAVESRPTANQITDVALGGDVL